MDSDRAGDALELDWLLGRGPSQDAGGLDSRGAGAQSWADELAGWNLQIGPDAFGLDLGKHAGLDACTQLDVLGPFFF